MKTCNTVLSFTTTKNDSPTALFSEALFSCSDSLNFKGEKKNRFKEALQLVFPPRGCQAVLQASVDIFNLCFLH